MKLISNDRKKKCLKYLIFFKKGIYSMRCLCKICLSKAYAVVMKLFGKLHIDRTLLACIIKLAICISFICYLSTWFFKATHNIEYTIGSEVAVLDGYYRIDTIGIDISMLKDTKQFVWKSIQQITAKSYAIIRAKRPINSLYDLSTCTYHGKHMDSICAIFQIQSFTETKYSKNLNHERMTNEYKYDGNKHIFRKHGDVTTSHEQKKIDIHTVFVPIKYQEYCGEIELNNNLTVENTIRWLEPNNIYRLCINFNLRWKNKHLQDVSKSTLIIRMNEPTDFVSIYPEPDVRTLSSIEYYDVSKLKNIQSHGIHLLADSLENKNKHDLIMLFLAAILSILLSATFSILWKTVKFVTIKMRDKQRK